MNGRIKELARQCGAYHKDDDGQEADVAILIGKEVEKFAELIVRECLNQCYNRGMNDELYAGQLKAAEYIEQHFGIT